LKQEPNLLYLNDPITVVGDIHGQFYDMMGMLELGRQNGGFGNRKYLFLGDYVDRGTWAIEVLIYLYSLKINYPKNIFLLRGNHETRECTQSYNFKQEVLHKHDQEIYDLVLDSFDCLPLAAVLNGEYFCVHAGISPAFEKASDIEKIQRFQEVPADGPACDLVWSDPTENSSGKVSRRFEFNDKRNCSVIYGRSEVASFLQKSKLKCIIRAHEVQLEGYKEHFWGGKSDPMVITLFSAPNYCGSYRNQGAIMQFHNGKYEMNQYGWSDAPWCLPNFNDIWNWSMPFIIQKVVSMFYYVMDVTNHAEQDELTPEEDARFEAMYARGELDSLLSKDQSSSHRGSLLRSFQKINMIASESDDVFNSIDLNGKKIKNAHLEGLDLPGMFKRISQEDEANEKRSTDVNFEDSGNVQGKKSESNLPASKDQVLATGHDTDGFGRSFVVGNAANRKPSGNFVGDAGQNGAGRDEPGQTGNRDALRRYEEKMAQQKYQRPQIPQEP
jgi:serine/threonine-protein phosphatase 2B catalytic subunit